MCWALWDMARGKVERFVTRILMHKPRHKQWLKKVLITNIYKLGDYFHYFLSDQNERELLGLNTKRTVSLGYRSQYIRIILKTNVDGNASIGT